MPYPALGTLRQTLKDLVLRIKGMQNSDGSPMFQQYSVWNDQVARMINGKGISFATPACFVEMIEYNREQLGYGVTAQDMYVNFHIVHDQLDGGQTQLDILDDTMDLDLDVMDLRTAVRKVFTNFNPSNCSSFGFSKEKQDFKHTNVYHMVTSFKTKYLDYSACPFVNGEMKTITGGTYTVTQEDEIVPDLNSTGVGFDIVGSTLYVA